mgnify:CR=1 FL=1
MRGVVVKPEDVIFSAGVSEALQFLFGLFALSNIGERHKRLYESAMFIQAWHTCCDYGANFTIRAHQLSFIRGNLTFTPEGVVLFA